MGSGKGCVAGLMGCVLIIVNTVFMLLGLALLIVGAIAYFGSGVITKSTKIYEFIDDKLPGDFKSSDLGDLNIEDYIEPAGIAVMAVGAVMFITSIIGLCGACCKLRVLLIVYAIIIGVITLAQIAVLVSLFGFTDKITEPIKDEWKRSITELYAGDDSDDKVYGPVSLFWTATNRFLECCGVDGYEDFKSAKHWNRTDASVETPLSCCKYNDTFPKGDPVNPNCNKKTLEPAFNNFNTSCWSAMEEKLKMPSETFLYVVIGSIAVEIALVVFAICVCRDAEVFKS